MWPAYVINLADNTARMDNSARALAAQGIAYERIDAVNGWHLPDARIAEVYDSAANARRGRHDLVRPEIGCYLSHIAAWERIASGEADGGVIFEDDFEAEDSLAEILHLISTDPARDWDMVKLFTFDPEARTISDRPLGDSHRIVQPYRVPTCLIGYAVTRDAARRLANRAVPFFRPVDEDQKFFWETGLRVALVLPAPIQIGDQQTVTGTIGGERRKSPRDGGLRRVLRGLCYQMRYRVALHWHRLTDRTG